MFSGLIRYGVQTFEAEQVWPDAQLPQFIVPPHPSGTDPQFLANDTQVDG